jgi:hypothetical protein
MAIAFVHQYLRDAGGADGKPGADATAQGSAPQRPIATLGD